MSLEQHPKQPLKGLGVVFSRTCLECRDLVRICVDHVARVFDDPGDEQVPQVAQQFDRESRRIYTAVDRRAHCGQGTRGVLREHGCQNFLAQPAVHEIEDRVRVAFREPPKTPRIVGFAKDN